ncbi:MAG: hypothetical protein IPI38_10050 [Gemmatimonadetes bacterium]|nr:hypothetical protein [Gemmatimonadota bacterium]MBP6670806.1 hypothetical protein [Gemmatimonadales bacterium]MBK6781711.1 hypothetical protein [Gemmatimonadota bacterium]MBK7350138.1 hypothetical protein [Gemmatimonadota bacterium]MBK7715753.1 hypothetical protein [Gemmatimonadota bacterium]
MRARTAVGLFLAVAGAMVLLLRPVYRGASPDLTGAVEATGPVEVYHPVPGWVGVLAVLAGGVLLVGGRDAPRRRGHR